MKIFEIWLRYWGSFLRIMYRRSLMKCLRCGNEDPDFFYKGSRGYYCRKCIRFKRVLLEEELESFDYEIAADAGEYHFSYELTDKQKEASADCLKLLKEGNDVLLHCVCGAGKTEIAVESISYYLKRGLKVAYAISRKEVVIELSQRFTDIFQKSRVIAVYGGHHEKLSGDLIVCTCHQLYRYYRSFDLLILDEVDAFPLKGDETLMNIAINSCKGRIIFSTATIDEDLQKILQVRDAKAVELFVRPSLRPLSVPKQIYLRRFPAYLYLYRLMSLTANRCIIFVSNRRDCRLLYQIFSRFFSCTYVYSDLKERKENIEAFRKGKYQFIFSTSVLERGITIKDIDVIILDHDGIFDESNLVQMLGRVGRGIDSEQGRSYLLADKKDKPIKETISYLQRANSCL